ncbi:MAG: XdhC family protein [Actinomycetota bacterium]|nr:XdhC family protein [Actinomycetota bacterium]
MTTDALTRRAEGLSAQSVPYVLAKVVRAQRPTSALAGDVALVLADGSIEGFVGGVCAEQSVRLHALHVLEAGEAVLLRILPGDGEDTTDEEGSVTVQNPCLSGGAIEVFLEPVLPAPRVVVVGATPVAGALKRLGQELGLEVAAVHDGAPDPSEADLALVVAAHGRDELEALRRGLDAGLPYVGLVASDVRGAAVIEELRAGGVNEERLAALETPAGIDIGARTAAEIALSILARIVAVRRGGQLPARPRAALPDGPPAAVDPVCGMAVAAVAQTPQVQRDGRTVYFCCEGCKAKFEQDQGAVAVPR